MNKKNLWFLTLFSLILILGVYYITLPSEIFSDKYNTDKVNKNIDINVSENNKLVALRVERDEKVADLMSKLQEKIVSPSSTSEEKSSAFSELQVLNLAKGKENYWEEKILKEYNVNSYVESNNDNIYITISSKDHSNTLANDIMRSVQAEFETKKNITVKFESN